MRHCPDCGGDRATVQIPYDIECRANGKLWPVHLDALTVIKCLGCGEIYFTNISDDEITAALARKLQVGYEPGDVCNRNGRPGIIEEHEVENCTCFISPPCNRCVEDRTYCPACGWRGRDEE